MIESIRIICRRVPGLRQEMVDYINRNVPGVEWVVDKHRSGADTFMEAMAFVGEDAAVHIEEDILITKDFIPKLLKVINEKPNNLIQFFSMRKKDHSEGSRWDNTFTMNQCHYHPPGYSRMILEFCMTWEGWASDPNGYDMAMRAWLKSRKERYWIHCPSLVDHRVAKSLLGPRSSKRQSFTFRDPIED